MIRDNNTENSISTQQVITLTSYPKLVKVGDIGAAGYTSSSSGSSINKLDYAYSIGKFKVTNSEYVEFLNAVARVSDVFNIYSTYNDEIIRTNSNGVSVYTVSSDKELYPARYISLLDAYRYCNWLHNKKPTSYGVQNEFTTEQGAYDLSVNGVVTYLTADNKWVRPTRKNSAEWFVPSNSELGKAIFYKGNGLNTGYTKILADLYSSDAFTSAYRAKVNTYTGKELVDNAGLQVVSSVFSNEVTAIASTSIRSISINGNIDDVLPAISVTSKSADVCLRLGSSLEPIIPPIVNTSACSNYNCVPLDSALNGGDVVQHGVGADIKGNYIVGLTSGAIYRPNGKGSMFAVNGVNSTRADIGMNGVLLPPGSISGNFCFSDGTCFARNYTYQDSKRFIEGETLEFVNFWAKGFNQEFVLYKKISNDVFCLCCPDVNAIINPNPSQTPTPTKTPTKTPTLTLTPTKPGECVTCVLKTIIDNAGCSRIAVDSSNSTNTTDVYVNGKSSSRAALFAKILSDYKVTRNLNIQGSSVALVASAINTFILSAPTNCTVLSVIVLNDSADAGSANWNTITNTINTKHPGLKLEVYILRVSGATIPANVDLQLKTFVESAPEYVNKIVFENFKSYNSTGQTTILNDVFTSTYTSHYSCLDKYGKTVTVSTTEASSLEQAKLIAISKGACVPPPTPTNTRTPSKTPTNTRTPSKTPTNTRTPSKTPTNTPTFTRTPTITKTPTRTTTSGFVASRTPTLTPTNTKTPTPTPTLTTKYTPKLQSVNYVTEAWANPDGSDHFILDRTLEDVCRTFKSEGQIGSSPSKRLRYISLEIGSPIYSVWNKTGYLPAVNGYYRLWFNDVDGPSDVVIHVVDGKIVEKSNNPCGLQKLLVNYNNTSIDVYRTTCYPMTALITGFKRDPSGSLINSNDQVVFDNILLAFDHWSEILCGSEFLPMSNSTQYYDGKTYRLNPLQGIENRGIVLGVNVYNAADGFLGAAAPLMKRTLPEHYNTKSFGIPYEGYLVLNTRYLYDTVTPTTGDRTELFYVVLHEIGHALGIGTNWHMMYTTKTSQKFLGRSFIVGAGDNTTNPLGLSISANFFYTTINLNNNRTMFDVGKPVKLKHPNTNTVTDFYIGDADIPFAFNGFAIEAPSKAVSYYNQAFNTNLTAIPVENGVGIGSIGSHWEEGIGASSYGSDNRAYYGSLQPGAPGLNDELMTPQSEGNIDMPISKITFGALEDLGYTVNYNLADNFEPLKYIIKYDTAINTSILVSFYNMITHTGKQVWNTNRTIYLRKGLTYSFVVNSMENIYITQTLSNLTSSPVGITNNGVKNGTITYSVPYNVQSTTLYIANNTGQHVVINIL